MKAPTDNLFRAVRPGVELRADDDGGMPTMAGHFTVFNQWAEISSFWEGNFMERIAPGAFTKTVRENLDQVKVEFNHGMDPQVGDKVLGPIEVLREEKKGPYYEVPLLDTSYNRDIIPGLEAGLYGSSFRFKIMKETWEDEPGTSASNPKGLPERTVEEVRLFEFGPVTFPAYAEATAGIRSLTDHFIERMLRSADPETLRRLHQFYETLRTPDDPSRLDHSDEGAAPPAAEPREHSEATPMRRARLMEVQLICKGVKT